MQGQCPKMIATWEKRVLLATSLALTPKVATSSSNIGQDYLYSLTIPREIEALLMLMRVCLKFSFVMCIVFLTLTLLFIMCPLMWLCILVFGQENMSVPFSISTSLGDFMAVKKVYRECVVSISSRRALVDLTDSGIFYFDIFLGMD